MVRNTPDLTPAILKGVVEAPCNQRFWDRRRFSGMNAADSGMVCFFLLDPEQNLCLISDSLPLDLGESNKWRRIPHSRLLLFECPAPDRQAAKIDIDTVLFGFLFEL